MFPLLKSKAVEKDFFVFCQVKNLMKFLNVCGDLT